MNIIKISVAVTLVGIPGFFHSFSAKAQESDVALAHVKYQFIHIDDTNFRDDPHREDMMLYIGKDITLYNSFSLATTLAKMKNDMTEKQPGDAKKAGAPNSRNQPRFFVNAPNISHEVLYLFPKENRLAAVNRLGMTTYIIEQAYPQIDWKIGIEVREIGGYPCQQATGSFGGRDYIAWFTTELPFPYGPWKLHGLPGLILEAEDSKKEVAFHYAGFDKEPPTGTVLALPQDAIPATAKEYAKAKAAFDKNPMGNALRGHNVPAGANVQRKIVLKDQSGRELSPEEFTAMREMAMREGKIKKPNNPLELVDNNGGTR